MKTSQISASNSKQVLLILLFAMISITVSAQTGKIIDGYFIGAWFKIKVPTNFSVKPSLKSASLNTPEGFDSILFISPDKDVEFYVYFPKLMGRTTDFEFNKNNENMASESKTGDSKKTLEYSTYTAKDKSYTKSLVVITVSNTTNYAFGVKYKNQIAYDRYKTEYLEFKKSLIENRDGSKIPGNVQNRPPIHGFNGAMEAVMQIVDNNPQIYTRISSLNPDNIAMCGAAGMFAAARIVINQERYTEAEIKVHAFNAGVMTRAFARLESTGILPGGSLMPYVNRLKQEGVTAFNEMWPTCDKIGASIIALIQNEYSIYTLRPLIR